jgi:hypothetical protein
MRSFARIPSKRIRIGGDQHTGWLPEGAATPLPTPIRDLDFDFEITDDGSQHFLLVYQSHDKSCHGDTWHKTLEDAFDAAQEYFGIQRDEWSII